MSRWYLAAVAVAAMVAFAVSGSMLLNTAYDVMNADSQSEFHTPNLFNQFIVMPEKKNKRETRATAKLVGPRPQKEEIRIVGSNSGLLGGMKSNVMPGPTDPVVGDSRGGLRLIDQARPRLEAPERAVEDSPATGGSHSEHYQNPGINPLTDTREDRFSTFAIDVDTASYTIVRRKLNEDTLPDKDAVRVEEFINFFKYTYPQSKLSPLTVAMDATPSPFHRDRHFLRVGVQGKSLSKGERKPAHLTFLVDVSGSMQSADKLPLAKRALRLLVDNLKDGDTVALVTYAGGVRDVLPPTGLEHRERIISAIESLNAGGSTAMNSGLELAYRNAMKTLDSQSTSRVIVLSDGDANVGARSHQEILKTIHGYVSEGITLSVVGFGMGNYKDALMEALADKGNGNYSYVDSMDEAKRIFQEQLNGTLEVIAQDVKIQVEFDPAQVTHYRLVGYENRDVADHDFRNDRVDAGEVGAGHSVTALYEVRLAPGAGEGLATVRIRAKKPRGEDAHEWAFTFHKPQLARTFGAASQDLRFAIAVMGLAELLRESPYAETWTWSRVLQIAQEASRADQPERQEFMRLVQRAMELKARLAFR